MSVNYQQNRSVLINFPEELLEQPAVLEPIPSQNNGYPSSNADYPSNNFTSNQTPVYEDLNLLPTNTSSSTYFIDPTLDTSPTDFTTLTDFGNIDPFEEDFEPMMRNRSCTWPRSRLNNETTNNSPVLLQQQQVVEREVLQNQNGSQVLVQTTTQAPLMTNQVSNNAYFESNTQEMSYNLPASCSKESFANPDDEDSCQSADCSPQNRHNAWGKMSYAEMITQAITSAPNQRLTLSQIYEWMIQNVPYFSDKGNTTSSAGWKNSVRHNLSLHSRFMRIQNDGPGKSSWWVINPNGTKPAKPSQRRATMDASTKRMIAKKRRGALKHAERQIPANTWFNPRKVVPQPENNSSYGSFRPRTISNVSNLSEHQVSPPLSPNSCSNQSYASVIPQTACNKNVNDIVSQTDQICLDTDDEYSRMSQNGQPAIVYSTNLQQFPTNFQHFPMNLQINQQETEPHIQQISLEETKAVNDLKNQLKDLPSNNQQDQFFTQQDQFSTQQDQFHPPTTSSNYAFGVNRYLDEDSQPTIAFYGQQQQPIEVVPNIRLSKQLEDLNAIPSIDFELQVIDEFIMDELSRSSL